LLAALARLGQPLYGCATPDGYRDTEAAWLSPDASLLRVNFATALTAGHLPFVDGEKAVEPAPLVTLLDPALSDKTRAVVRPVIGELQAALILGSPDFMRR
jgi:uncharacterized protein (DUF1800 family)